MGRMLLSICAVVVAMGLGGLQQADQPGRADSGQAPSGAQVASPVVPPPQPSPDIEDPGCERGQDDRGSDLCAQWKAADAARSSANAAWWLGIVGLMIGGLTLWAASRAAHWAKEAARHTEDGAKAGWAAEKVTRESSERQLRAYLSVDEILISRIVEGEPLTAWVKVVNRGQTPARKVKQRECVIRAIGVPIRNPKVKFGPWISVYDLGAGQKVSLPSTLVSDDLTSDQVISLMTGNVEFQVSGYITYCDVFGRKRRVIYQAELTGESFRRATENESIHFIVGNKGCRSD